MESDSDAARATAFVMVDVTMGATEKACDYLEPKTVREATAALELKTTAEDCRRCRG